VWDKARLSLELAESKLRTLHSQLKLQDKEELTLKRLKAEGGDKVLSSIMDPDPDWIRIQSSPWIRIRNSESVSGIRNPDPDPGGQK
jgi:hypothetical protein